MSVTKSAKAAVKRVIKSALPTYRREAALSKRLIADIEQLGFERLRQRHANFQDNSRKYLQLHDYFPEAVRLAGRLGVLSSKPMSMLDIGCGSGYFLFVGKRSGHEVVGLDLPDNPLYNDSVQLLGIPRVAHRVEKFQPLPDFGKPLDLITAFSICFDLHATEDVWGPEEWKFFLDDCRSRLNPGGRIFLNFNPATTRDFRFVPDKVATFLRSLPGGTLTSSKEFFTLVRA
jgi:2-polyprenyl-3-methyl-5-hydroxy-6-metoxy-1,4-benzoquinol methylase